MEGVVPGGGVALLNLIPALEEVKVEGADEATALRCLQRAFEAPLRQLAANAGQDGSAVVGQVRWLQHKLGNPRIGYDVLRQEFGDVVEWGIMDPALVVRTIVRNAVSVAAMILTVCHYGHSRSVAAAMVLHRRGIPAIACGLGTAGPWLPTLFSSASKIVVMDRGMLVDIPEEFRDKAVACHVGPDRWSNPYNRELQALVEQEIEGCLP